MIPNSWNYLTHTVLGVILCIGAIVLPALSQERPSTEQIIESILQSESTPKNSVPRDNSTRNDTVPSGNENPQFPGSEDTGENSKKSMTSPAADEVLYKTGIQFYESEMYEAAIKNFNDLKSKYPQSQFTQNGAIWSGKANLQLRKFSTAIQNFSSIDQQSGEYPASLFYVGESYLRMGKRADSVNYFYRVATQFPKYELAVDALIKLGTIYLQDRKGSLALKAAARVIRLYGDDSNIDDAYYLIAQVYEKDPVLRDVEISRKVYKTFIEKAGNNESHFKNSPLLKRVKRDLRHIERTFFRYER